MAVKEVVSKARTFATERRRRLLPSRIPFVVSQPRFPYILYIDARILLGLKKETGLRGIKIAGLHHFREFLPEIQEDNSAKYRTTEYLSNQSQDTISLSYIAANPRDRSEPLAFPDPESEQNSHISLSEYRAALFGLCQQLDAMQAFDPLPYSEIQEYAVCFACCFYQKLIDQWNLAKHTSNVEDSCRVINIGADLNTLLKSVSVFDAGWRSVQEKIFDFCMTRMKATVDKEVQREIWRIKTHDPSQPIPLPTILDGAAGLAQFSPNSSTSLTLLSHSSGICLSLARGLLQLALSDTCVTLKRLDRLAETAAVFRIHLCEQLQKIAHDARCVRSTSLRVLDTDRIAGILARATAVARQKTQLRLKEQIAQNFVSRLTLKIQNSDKTSVLELLRQVTKDSQISLTELGRSAELFEAGVVQCLLMGYFSAVFIGFPDYLQVVERIKIDEQSVIEVLVDVDLLCEKECRALYLNVVDGLTKPYVLCQVPLSKLNDQEMVSSIIKLREKVTKQVRAKKIPTNKQHMYCPLSEAELAHLRTTHKLEVRRTTLNAIKDPDLHGWTVLADPTTMETQKTEEPNIKLGSHHLNIQSQLLIYKFLHRFRARRAAKLTSPEVDDLGKLPQIENDIDEKRSAELFNSYLQNADTMQNHFLFGSKLPTTNKHVSGFVSSFGNVQSAAIDPREHTIKQQFVLMELVTRVTVSQPTYEWYKHNMRELLSKEFSPG